MIIRTNKGIDYKAPEQHHRWWAHCTKCGLLTYTYESEAKLMKYLDGSTGR